MERNTLRSFALLTSEHWHTVISVHGRARSLVQVRFASFVMDEPHMLAAVRYVELNPARAKLVDDAVHWRWSSAQSHLLGRDDCQVAPMLAMVHDWRGFLSGAIPEEQ